ncbi:MAG TPA: hypothetical protein VFM97_01845 [Gammaproteobacteria bacterium]|nr:hypothetical protein [Gammaproteobacteria bacterium]
MPNGFHGPNEQWDRMEAPLLTLDAELEAFAKTFDLGLSKNYHNWPERSLTWSDGVDRLIQIYLADEEAMTFNLWLCASQDRGRERYLKKEFLIKEKPIGCIANRLNELLEQAKGRLEGWKAADLEFATTIAQIT